MDNDVEIYRKRIAELEQEIRALKENRTLSTAPRTIFGLTNIVIQTDENLNITYMNSAAENHIMKSRNEMIGKHISSIIAPGLNPEKLVEYISNAIKFQRPYEVETRYIHPMSGKEHFIKITATTLANGAQIMVEDISKLKIIEQSFKKYVSPKVIDQITAQGVDVFKPRKYELSVLFADLRGFTAMSSHLEPEQVKEIIDEFLSAMIKTVIDSDAMVDKIVGDEVMALFGAPVPYDDHALRAVNCAINMQRAHNKLIDKWGREGKPQPKVGIGINSGIMMVGNIGSEQLTNYTVLGHNVNLASRLCAAAPGGFILISEYTFELVKKSLVNNQAAIQGRVKFKQGDIIEAKGIPQPVQTIMIEIVE
ncbi:MAG: PAS domain S-box protein [Deltaproteobacteria bacterium]|nr:PAS domain S-box protein [Deltaproteobacteria bacterium]